MRTSGEAPSASSLQNNTIQYVLMAVLPVILIIAGMALYIYKRNKSIYPQLQPLKKAMWEWFILSIKLCFFIPGKKTTGNNSRGSKTGGENNDEVN